jgi:hypothetical protein
MIKKIIKDLTMILIIIIIIIILTKRMILKQQKVFNSFLEIIKLFGEIFEKKKNKQDRLTLFKLFNCFNFHKHLC